mmetsp:Transcript_123318/g.343956  ORF Transcript_123318/g.343956 Transcript_123318/m.343956 type:complete len:82 (-) Transcript_123318:193-438(-)
MQGSKPRPTPGLGPEGPYLADATPALCKGGAGDSRGVIIVGASVVAAPRRGLLIRRIAKAHVRLTCGRDQHAELMHRQRAA